MPLVSRALTSALCTADRLAETRLMGSPLFFAFDRLAKRATPPDVRIFGRIPFEPSEIQSNEFIFGRRAARLMDNFFSFHAID